MTVAVDKTDLPQDHISFDRRIPVAVIILLIAQIFGFGWYVSALDARLGAVESAITKTSALDQNYDREVRLMIERLARIETQIGYLVEGFRDLRGRSYIPPVLPPLNNGSPPP